LKDVLQNPLFKSFQKRQPFNDNHLAPCPIIDNPQALRDIVIESKARATHQGAAEVLEGPVAVHLDQISLQWKEKADKIKAAREQAKEPAHA
jgi:hypothetical protein